MKPQLRVFVRRARVSRSDGSGSGFTGFFLLGFSFLGFYCSFFPSHAGTAGTLLARASARAFGEGAYLAWFLIAYRGFRLIFHRESRKPWRYVLVDVLLMAAACSFLSAFGQIFLSINPGGHAGRFFNSTLAGLFGRWGAFFIAGFGVLTVILWRRGVTPGEFISWLQGRIRGDWNEWRREVAVEKERVRQPAKKKSLPRVHSPVNSGKNPAVPAAAAASSIPKINEAASLKNRDRTVVPANRRSGEKPVAPDPRITGSQAHAVPAEDEDPYAGYQLPSIELFTLPDRAPRMRKEEDLLANAQLLEKTLLDFGVQGKVVEIHPGPIITRFDFTPAPGIKVQAVASLANDIAMAMSAFSVRILAPIPGKSAVGVEIPNPKRAIVRLREIFESEPFLNHKSRLALGLGKDAEGRPYVADLAGAPHMLIGGSTGSGKSVCIHSIIMSILLRASPQEVKLLLIDPKRVELPVYNGIPHLYDPNQDPDNVRVITDPKEAAKALQSVVKVMDHRFKKLSSSMARDIDQYNEKMRAEGRPIEPFIVVIIDELADLMAVSAKEVEQSIQRLAQMARAVGIHLVLATQRPSVDVITGVIKANLPARLAFRVASQTDSRVILDFMGAESLLGEGDLLFLPPGSPKPFRLQCGFVTNQEVQNVTDYVRSMGKPSYERLLSPVNSGSGGFESSGSQEEDDLRAALMLVCERKRVSQDLLKAHFGSSARATDLLSVLEVKGFIAKPEGTNRWTIFFDRIDAYLSQIKSQVPSN
jgi:S-DNA-T family DNA segregation ATPase FtsK/SpoIIIE